MKWIGIVIILLTSSFYGLDVSQRLRARTKELRQLIQSLQMFEAEMMYGQYALRQIFQHISGRTEGPIAQFYERMSDKLSGTITDFVKLWEDEVSQLYRDSHLAENEMEIFRQLGSNIGFYHIDDQKKHLSLAKHYLNQQLDEAIEQEQKYVTTTKSLGVLIGILVVLILI